MSAAASTIAPAAAGLRTTPHPSLVDPPQHLRALARANEVRLARAALKRDIASGRTSAAEIVLHCPWEARSMTIAELLGAQRRWGKARSRKLLASLELKENKELGSLTERQRGVLFRELHRRLLK